MLTRLKVVKVLMLLSRVAWVRNCVKGIKKTDFVPFLLVCIWGVGAFRDVRKV